MQEEAQRIGAETAQAEIDEMQQRIAALTAERDALRAQLAAAQAAGDWRPCEDGTYIIGSGQVDVMEQNTLGIMGADEVGEDAYATLALDADHAFCRRDPQAQAAPNPLPRIYQCNNIECLWAGVEAETVHPKHEPAALLCPRCYETIGELTVHGLADALRPRPNEEARP